MLCAVLLRRSPDGRSAMVSIGHSVFNGVSFAGVRSFSLVWRTDVEGSPSAVGSRSLFVGHTTGSTRLGDRYSSHDDLTAVREISQNSRISARVAGGRIVFFRKGGAVVRGETVACLWGGKGRKGFHTSHVQPVGSSSNENMATQIHSDKGFPTQATSIDTRVQC